MLVSSEAANRNKRISMKKQREYGGRLRGEGRRFPHSSRRTKMSCIHLHISLTVKLTTRVINCNVGDSVVHPDNLTNMQRG